MIKEMLIVQFEKIIKFQSKDWFLLNACLTFC